MPDVVVKKRSVPLSKDLSPMSYGSMSNDDNAFTMSFGAYEKSLRANPDNRRILKLSVGGNELSMVSFAPTLYIADDTQVTHDQIAEFSEVFERVREYRSKSVRLATRRLSATPMLFAERRQRPGDKIFVPQYFPSGGRL